MGKGDGKSKKPKKSKATPAIEAVVVSKPPPQRVTNDVNIPVRYQIRWAQMHKKAAKAEGPSFRQKKVERTRYRRAWGKLWIAH
jgi:hypothetical protein